jgi:CRP-like cAMP-binding protein
MTYLLRNIRLFEAFSEGERADLVHFMHEKGYAAGETLCTRGEHGNSMIVVVRGALSAMVPGVDNQPREIAHLSKGAVFGEMFCIDPAPRPATVVACESATVLELGRENLITMRQHAPSAAAALVSAVFHDVLRRLRSVDERIERELCANGRLPPNGKGDSSLSSRMDVPSPWELCFARLRGSA